MPRRRVDLLGRSDQGGQAVSQRCRRVSQPHWVRCRIARGPCSFRTKDGPTPIAVALIVARLKKLVWRIASGWARSRADPARPAAHLGELALRA